MLRPNEIGDLKGRSRSVLSALNTCSCKLSYAAAARARRNSAAPRAALSGFAAARALVAGISQHTGNTRLRPPFYSIPILNTCIRS